MPAVSEQAIEAPASVSESNGRRGLGLTAGDPKQIVATTSTTGIPAAALAAYQRAESVINRADDSCHLTWQLVAAIGRVESDHGRAQGNRLDQNGVASPGIFGVALTGKRGTRAIRDTDAGLFDNDSVWDRAVGPMQFIPGTWSAVGVDGDGDGLRDPQDVDDAALASAVYLCSGTDDLSTRVGQRAAVYRYNHSRSYVNLVVSLMKAYLQGDWGQVPTSTLAAGSLSLTSSGPLVPVGGVRVLTSRGSDREFREAGGSGTGAFEYEAGSHDPGGPEKSPKPTPTKPAAPEKPSATPPGGEETPLPVEEEPVEEEPVEEEPVEESGQQQPIDGKPTEGQSCSTPPETSPEQQSAEEPECEGPPAHADEQPPADESTEPLETEEAVLPED